MAALGGLALLFLHLVLSATCLPTDPPRLTANQLRLHTEILNAGHMESAASRVSTLGPLLLFLMGILIPLGLVIWLVSLALRAKVDHEEGLRKIVKAGFSEEVTRAYLEETPQRPKLPKPVDDRKRLPHLVQYPRRRARRRRRRQANCGRSEKKTERGRAGSHRRICLAQEVRLLHPHQPEAEQFLR